jgi:release factor glutamine methyltransferase
MHTITSLLSQATTALKESGVDSPRFDAELLLAHVLGKERRWLWTYPETQPCAAEQATFAGLLARRCRREPLAYLLGEWEFYGRKFAVTPAVLIPRPETELLVEAVLAWAGARQPISAIDVGVGSGAIAVTLALENPRLQVLATDLSAPALSIARRNADRYGVGERIQWARGDLLDSILASSHPPVNIVVANLPYIAEDEMARLMPEVGSYEPQLALRAADGGMELIARLIAQAPAILANDGLLACEIGYNQAEIVHALLLTTHWQRIRFVTDYAGIPRHVLANLPAAVHHDGRSSAT